MKKRVIWLVSILLFCMSSVYGLDTVTVGDDGRNDPFTINSVSVSAVDTNSIFIAYIRNPAISSYELMFARTTDGGRNWNTQTIFTSTSGSMVPYLSAVSKDIIFISYYDYPTRKIMLLKSINGGQSWAAPITVGTAFYNGATSAVGTSFGGGHSFTALDANNLFMVYRPDGNAIKLARSANGGQSWAILSTIEDTGFNSATPDFTIRALDPDNVFITYWKWGAVQIGQGQLVSKLARSTNGGQSWTIRNIAPASALFAPPRYSPSLYVVDRDIMFVAYSSNYEASATTSIIKIAKTTNGGDTWRVKELDTTVDPVQNSFYPHVFGIGEKAISVLFTNKNGLHLARSVNGEDFLNLAEVIDNQLTNPYSAVDFSDFATLAVAYQGKVGDRTSRPGEIRFASVDSGFKDICEGTGASITGKSRWQGTLAEVNPCCGDEPDRDRGFLGSDTTQGANSFLCYEKDGFWGWLPASSHDWEVKHIGANDAVSNSEEWFVCNQNRPGMYVPFPIQSDTDSTRAHGKKFYCEDRGGNYRFAECCVPDASDDRECEEDNELQMSPGQATTLLLKDVTKTFTQTEFIELVYNPDLDQGDFDISDWSMYSRLDIIFNASESFDIFLEAYNDNNANVLPAKLTDYVVNTPLLNKWMHAQIPISGLTNIKKIRFRFTAHLRPGETISNKLHIQQAMLVPTVHRYVGTTLTPMAGELTYCSAVKYKKSYSEDIWIKDLDSPATDADNIPAGKIACNAIGGLNWTGNQCCGDDNALLSTEYYIDSEAICWNGHALGKGNTAMNVVIDLPNPTTNFQVSYFCPYNQCVYPILSGAAGTIANSYSTLYDLSFYDYRDGQYYNIPQSGFSITGKEGYVRATSVPQEILYTPDRRIFACNPSIITQARNTLFDGAALCEAKGNYFCSPGLGWSDVVSAYADLTLRPEERNTFKNSSALGINSVSCCSAASCWNGTVCVADQSSTPDPNDPRAEIYRGARCVNGNWVVTRKVFTWDKKESGYCSQQTQCLVDFEGNANANNQPLEYYKGNSPLCIDNGQYILDNYCMNGNWTTRTKFIALELLDYVQKVQPVNYTLFCDEPSAALVDLDYGTVLDYIWGSPAATGFGTNAIRTCFANSPQALPCANNFCVLDYVTRAGDRKKAFGVSLNKDVADNAASFLNALGLDKRYCDTLQGFGRYRKCSGDDKVWFNPAQASIIYSRDNINLGTATTLETVGKWFRDLYYGLINWLLGKPTPPNTSEDYSFTTNTSRFNKLYIDSRPGSTIYGFQETVGENTFMLINYKGFQTNICTYVNNRLSIPGTGSTPSGVVCEVLAPGNTVVYTNDAVAASLWQQFTSALRVS